MNMKDKKFQKEILLSSILPNNQQTLSLVSALKVSKSWKQIMKFRIHPKNEQNTLRIYPEYVSFILFFWKNQRNHICFRDLLTFSI